MADETRTVLDWSGLEVLDLEECYRLLAEENVGRLGFVDQGEPVVLPVNYGLRGRSIVFRTAFGSKLDAAIMERPVCLEIDSWDTAGRTGWSVLVKGSAEVVAEEDAEELERLGVTPWSRPDLRRHWVAVRPNEVTGRRIDQ